MKSAYQVTDARSDSHRVHAVMADSALAMHAIWQPYAYGVPICQAIVTMKTPRRTAALARFICLSRCRTRAAKAKHRVSAIAVESVALA